MDAITKNIEGKNLLKCMICATAVLLHLPMALHPVQTPGLFLKALQYVKAFDGSIIQVPVDSSIAKSGFNE